MPVQSSLYKSRSDILLNICYLLTLVLFVAIRTAVYFKLNLNLIDSDQPYMWLGASDYAKGLFYEPRYYAQDYNTFMEALFAVPFIWMNIPVYFAVPLATHLIFAFPFLFSSFYLFFKQKKMQAILIPAIILCLPADYDLLTSLPRGFVTGLFFSSFFVISILNPYALWAIVLNTVFAITGYFVNPNSVLVSMPFLFYIFLHHYKNPRYYFVTTMCLPLIWILHLFFNQFYIDHPGYVVNDIHYRLSTVFFWENISSLDKRFAHISPFFSENCLLLLCVLVVLAGLLFKKNKRALAAFGVFLLTVLFSFCSGKTQEGSTWAYMSYSRMYLGIPIFIGLFLSTVELRAKKMHLIFLSLPVLFASYKFCNLEKLVSPNYSDKKWTGVRLISLKETFGALDFYKKACKEKGSDFLLVSNGFWLHNYICYGGPAVDHDFPQTRETKLEKRYWVRNKSAGTVFGSFVLISSNQDLDKVLPRQTYFEIQRIDDYGLFFIRNNSLKTYDFINFINGSEP